MNPFTRYLLRRLFLLPITLFAIILVNFIILNMAPGDPSTRLDISATGEASRSEQAASATGDTHYLQFRERYGLTLPILFNTWPSISQNTVDRVIGKLATEKETMSVQDYHDLKTRWGDRARFIMPLLHHAMNARDHSFDFRMLAANLFIRGATRQGHVGPALSEAQKLENRKIAHDNATLLALRIKEQDSPETLDEKVTKLNTWFEENPAETLSFWGRVGIFFTETRFFRYMSRIITLDFGTLRSDANKTVLHEVGKRMKYSLTLALIPMLLTFGLCQVFGMWMAVKQNLWPDISLNVVFLILYAAPVFVVAPFLIEKIALPSHIPFAGFHSPEAVYEGYTSTKRLHDILLHIALPLVAIIYGTLAVQARLARTAALEVLRQDYVRTAQAKGLPWSAVLIKHVGRNAAITIVTSLAASLGIILGGSLIVETVFSINGFGRFFYEAILNRDYNVVLFSAFAGAFLTLVGYLIADICYTLLDPRVSFER